MTFMEFMNLRFLTVRVWIWAYFFFTLIFVTGVIIYFFRERIRGAYYKFRWPESTVRIIIHYPGRIYKRFWRLIPDAKTFNINKLKYMYDPKFFQKESDVFSFEKNNKRYVKIQGKDYELDDKNIIKRRKTNYPELHYFFNNPKAINFDDSKFTKPEMSSKEMAEFEEQDFFNKLLTLKDTNSKLVILIFLVIVNLLITGIIALKFFDILK